MSTITTETIRQIATLAHLDLDDATIARLTTQCARILAFVEQLNAVDTGNVPPMTHAACPASGKDAGGDIVPAWREDTVVASTQADAILANSPEHELRFFVVPKVMA